MKSQLRCYLLIIICVNFFTSCFTGRHYHHPRVRIEPAPQQHESIQQTIRSSKPDSSLKEKPVEEKTMLRDHPPRETKILEPSPKLKERDHKIFQKHLPKRNSIPKKSNDVKRWRVGDALEGAFALLFFLIIGLPSILLLIAGFLMGFFNIMVGFWICWVIGFLGITFAMIIYILIWAASEGDQGIGGTFFYLFFFLLAIAFILIVLLI